MKLPNYLPHRLYCFIFPLAVYENYISSVSLSIFSVLGVPCCAIFSAQLYKFKHQTDIRRGKTLDIPRRHLTFPNQSKSLPYIIFLNRYADLFLSAISLMKWLPLQVKSPFFKFLTFMDQRTHLLGLHGEPNIEASKSTLLLISLPNKPNFHFPSNSHSLYWSISLFNFALGKTVPDSFINIHLYIFTILSHSTGRQNSQPTEKIYSPTPALS